MFPRRLAQAMVMAKNADACAWSRKGSGLGVLKHL